MAAMTCLPMYLMPRQRYRRLTLLGDPPERHSSVFWFSIPRPAPISLRDVVTT